MWGLNERTSRESLPHLECDASNIGIGSMLLQEGHPISFFNEKLKAYDKELYALAWALQVWQHYLLLNELIIHSDHESFKCLKGKANIVGDTLSKGDALLAMLETKLRGFESLKDLYVTDVDFKEAYDSCAISANGGFFSQEGFLFKDKCLCMPKSFIQELLVKKAHKGGLMGHFSVCKTYEALCEHFYWPKMRCNMHHICERCLVCKIAKPKASSNGLYTPFPILTAP
ncbi:Retrovirus-related Pol polyprotein, partial [Mucuna pruriens]